MAMNADWDNVVARLHALQAFPFLRTSVDALLRLVDGLRNISSLEAVEPTVSLASIALRVQDVKRYVSVTWLDETQKYEIAFVDPSLEFLKEQRIPQADIVATVIDYVEQLKGLVLH